MTTACFLYSLFNRYAHSAGPMLNTQFDGIFGAQDQRKTFFVFLIQSLRAFRRAHAQYRTLRHFRRSGSETKIVVFLIQSLRAFRRAHAQYTILRHFRRSGSEKENVFWKLSVYHFLALGTIAMQ